jgi:hypothetical protein
MSRVTRAGRLVRQRAAQAPAGGLRRLGLDISHRCRRRRFRARRERLALQAEHRGRALPCTSHGGHHWPPPDRAAPQQNTAGFTTTAQSPSADAEQVTAAFLRAWSSGAIGAAASLTDDPAAARAALTAYDQDLYLRQLTGTVVIGHLLQRSS